MVGSRVNDFKGNRSFSYIIIRQYLTNGVFKRLKKYFSLQNYEPIETILTLLNNHFFCQDKISIKFLSAKKIIKNNYTISMPY